MIFLNVFKMMRILKKENGSRKNFAKPNSHERHRNEISKDHDIEDVLVITPKVSMPIVNSTG